MALCAFSSLYVDERRFPEGEGILAPALARFPTAKETVPVDIVKLHQVRGVLYLRIGRWEQVEADLLSALSSNDPVIPRPMLVHYAFVLRKTRLREAISPEAKVASFRATGPANMVVGVTELRRGAKLR